MPTLRTVSQEERRRMRHERRLKRIAMLPAVLTIGNLVSGFAAICCCLLSIQADGADLAKMTLNSPHFERMFPTYLSIGAILIALGLIFDGLDGRVARWSRKTSDFGGQLDSLADVVTFGTAPPLLMLCLMIQLPPPEGWAPELVTLARRATWVAAAVYAACAALRLARFNVENVHDESAHFWFKGLASPGAAGTIAALILYHEHVRDAFPGLAMGVEVVLPPATLAMGLLMVSRIRYAHFVNLYLRRKRPISHLVILLIVLLSIFIKPAWGLAIVASVYVISGPVGEIIRRIGGEDASAASTKRQPKADDESASTEHHSDHVG